MQNWYWLTLGLSLALFGCSVSGDETLGTATEEAAASPSQMAATLNIGTSTSDIHLTNTPTFLPTLEDEVVESKVIGLIETDTSCELPCWWGLKPGTSSIEDAQQLLEPFIGTIESDTQFNFTNNNGFVNFRIFQNGFDIAIYYFGENGVVDHIFVTTQMLVSIDGGYERVYDSNMYLEIMENFSLPRILSLYGSPSEIQFRSFSRSPSWFSSETILHYPEEGFALSYSSPTFLVDTENIGTCPLQSHISIHLFTPKGNRSLASLIERFDNPARYRGLEEASNFSVQSFFETFSKASNCSVIIQTPESLWPDVKN